MKIKVSISSLVIAIILILLLFQLPISRKISYFNFIDEFITCFFGLYIMINGLWKKRKNKYRVKMVLLLILFIGIGLVSSLCSDVNQNINAQLLDIMYMTKVFICFIGADIFFEKNKEKNAEILSILASFVKITVSIAFIMWPLNLLGITEAVGRERFGIIPYGFIYGSVGMFSQYIIGFLIILTANIINEKKENKNMIFIFLTLLLWLSTLRTRGFAIVFCYIILYLCIFRRKEFDAKYIINIKSIFKPQYVILVFIATILIAYDQIYEYFGELDSARAILLYYGIVIMIQYFPLGAGFATYGTEAARRYYSPIYYKYKINNFWALAEDGTELTDGYWPAVFGEFGVFGMFCIIGLVFTMIKLICKKSLFNKWILFSSIILIFNLLISSTVTGTFASYVTVDIILPLCLIINTNNREEEKYGNSNIV